MPSWPKSPVLVVEDDTEIRESIIDILIDEGFPAIGAQDGNQALSFLREGLAPALILLDLMMPKMDGLTFRSEQRKDPGLAKIPVVVISAYRDIEAATRTIAAEGVLKKPIQYGDLLQTVQRFCEPQL